MFALLRTLVFVLNKTDFKLLRFDYLSHPLKAVLVFFAVPMTF